MAALHASTLTNRRIYVFGPNSGAATGPYSIGNDSTGDGRASAPYATISGAMVALSTAEPTILSKIEVRVISGAGESNVYGDTTLSGVAQNPLTPSMAQGLIIRGWLKTWSDASESGVWAAASGSEKPRATFYFDRSTQITIKDISFRTSQVVSEYYVYHNSSSAPTIQTFGCVFGPEAFRSFCNSTSTGIVNHSACVFQGVDVLPMLAASSFTAVQSCTVNSIGKAQCITHISGLNAFTAQSSVFVLDGAGNYVFRNLTASDHKNLHRNNNRYFVTGGAGIMYSSTNVYNTLASLQAATTTAQDVYSSDGDPLFEDIGTHDYRLKDESPVLDKGGDYTGSYVQYAFDDTGSGFHNYDFLGQLWGDVSGPLESDGLGKFTHRSVGAFQNALGQVAPKPILTWPVGVLSTVTSYVAAKVPADADVTGTMQFRVCQANDASLTIGLVIKDSAPINVVTGSNDKINFKEGGGELTATVAAGSYTTATLSTAIKAALDTAGGQVYTVSYSSGTEKFTISAAGAFQLLFATGTNQAISVRTLIGFFSNDRAAATSHVSDDKVLENFYDASLSYQYSADYNPGVDANPTTGTWAVLGTGTPGNAGVEGTDGVLGDGTTRYVRVNLGTVAPLNGKYHAVAFWNGNLVSDDEA